MRNKKALFIGILIVLYIINFVQIYYEVHMEYIFGVIFFNSLVSFCFGAFYMALEDKNP